MASRSICRPATTRSRARAVPNTTAHTKEFSVDAKGPEELSFQLERWIDPVEIRLVFGRPSCSRRRLLALQNPAEGVLPKDMMRQICGEKLNVGAVLTWGPDYYYQKQFFSGHDDPLSMPNEKMHYDLEVSGFPSSHAGHMVLLGLKEQDYPRTRRRSRTGLRGTCRFCNGRSSRERSSGLRTRAGACRFRIRAPARVIEMPGFDGIGANEYIVDVTHPDTVDFISAGDTPYVWELSIWYHTLNVGFRTRIAGETDFPCITDDRVGRGAAT